MKISALETDLIDVPFPTAIKTAIHDMRSIGCVLLTVRTDQGLSGESYAFTLNGDRLNALAEMVNGFAPLVMGRDPHFIEAIWQDTFSVMSPIGHKGTGMAALSTIDTACWDLIGKAADKPLHKIFGASRDRVPTYASGGLWLSQTAEDCAREAMEFVDAGFEAVKLRIGNPKIADDIRRVKTVRDAIGPNIGLLVDANQSFTAKHAIRLGHALEDFDITWFEEPVPYHNLRGSREVTAAVSIPIASGETEYTRYGFRDLIEAEACDILMPDLQRVGGLTEMRRVGALAAAFDIPISTHLFTEHSLCAAASMSNCISVEHMPWAAPFLNETMQIENGDILVPERPGTGFTFNRDAVASLRL